MWQTLKKEIHNSRPEHRNVDKEVVVGLDNKVGLWAVAWDPMVPQDSFVRQVPNDGGRGEVVLSKINETGFWQLAIGYW